MSTTVIFIVAIFAVLMLMALWDAWMDRRYGVKSSPRPLRCQNRRTGNSPRDWR